MSRELAGLLVMLALAVALAMVFLWLDSMGGTQMLPDTR